LWQEFSGPHSENPVVHVDQAIVNGFIFRRHQYSADGKVVFESANPLAVQLVGLPFLLIGLYLFTILIRAVFSFENIDYDTQLLTDPDNPDSIYLSRFWGYVVIVAFMTPTLVFGMLAVFGRNRITVDSESNTIEKEFLFIKSLRRKQFELKSSSKINVGFTRRGRFWAVSHSGIPGNLTQFRSEQSARLFAFEAANRLGIGLNQIDFPDLSKNLRERLVYSGKYKNPPRQAKTGSIKVETHGETVVLYKAPAISFKVVLAGLIIVAGAAVFLTARNSSDFKLEQLLILIVAGLAFTALVLRVIILTLADQLFGISVSLSSDSIHISRNFRMFLRSSTHPIKGIRDILKDREGIVIVSERSITRFAKYLSNTDKTFLFNYLNHWVTASGSGEEYVNGVTQSPV